MHHITSIVSLKPKGVYNSQLAGQWQCCCRVAQWSGTDAPVAEDDVSDPVSPESVGVRLLAGLLPIQNTRSDKRENHNHVTTAVIMMHLNISNWNGFYVQQK